MLAEKKLYKNTRGKNFISNFRPYKSTYTDKHNKERNPYDRLLVKKRYGHKTLYTLDSKTLLGFSDFIPANSAADWTTWKDWGSSGGGGSVYVCVWGGGDEAISNLKGAGATHALPRSYLHVSCLPWPVL